MTESVTGPRADESEDELFRRYRATRSRALRNQLVERHMGLAAHIARRSGRGRVDDDLRQVAMLGLVKAVDRFDPERNVAFSAYAGATIEGELKRHFRDRTWAARVPRSVKERHLDIRRATDELSHTLGRSPSVAELARHLDLERDDVVAGLAAGAARAAGSLDTRAGDDDAPQDHDSVLGSTDAGFELAEHREIVAGLLAQLPARERRIVELRFFEERSQSDIADEVGISQMHVSRLLRRSFEMMRGWVDDELAH